MREAPKRLSKGRWQTCGGLALAAAMVFSPALTRAQTRYELAGDSLRISEPTMAREIPLGCTGTQLFVHDGLYIVCADGRVRRVVISGEGDQVSDVELAGPVERLFLLEGALWARTAQGVAPITGLTQLAPATPPTAEPSPSLASALPAPGESSTEPPAPMVEPAPPATVDVVATPTEASPARSSNERGPVVGRVIRVQGGFAIVEIARGQRVREEMGVEFTEVRENDAELEAELGGLEEEVSVSRGVVVAAGSERARVRLEVGGRAVQGMLVRSLPDTPGIQAFPALPEDTVTLGFHIRPFLPIGILGIGVIADVSVRYQSSFGLFVGADLLPGGFGASNAGDAGAAISTIYAGFAMRWFGFGIGVGPATANGLLPWSSVQGTDAVAIAPIVRIGSEDGFMLRGRTIVLAWSDQMYFGDMQIDLRIPVAHGIQLIVNGRGGNSGSQLGEAGVRLLLDGNGRSGSVFFTGTVGFGMLVAPSRCPSTARGCGRFNNAGPLLGAGVDWRI